MNHPGAFSPATSLVESEGLVATLTGYGLRLLNPADGSTIWDLQLSGDAPFPMGCYAKQPHPVIAPPIRYNDNLLLPGLDGQVRVISMAGEQVSSTQLTAPIAAGLGRSDDRLLALGTDGSLTCLDANQIGA